MSPFDWPLWGTLIGLSCLCVGGFVLWAYGARWTPKEVDALNHEPEATRLFHARLARFFFMYGIGLIVLGLAALLWANEQIS